MLVPICLARKPQIFAYVDVKSGARRVDLGLSRLLHPYLVYASTESSTESAHCTWSPYPPLLKMKLSPTFHVLAQLHKCTCMSICIAKLLPPNIMSRDMRFPTICYCICDQQMLRSACALAQSDQSLCLSLE